MSAPDLFAPIPELSEDDHKALHRQLTIIEQALRDGGWHTLANLAALSGATEAGASARVRDCRKLGWNVERMKVGPRRYAYRINGRLPLGEKPRAKPSPSEMWRELLALRERVEQLEREQANGGSR